MQEYLDLIEEYQKENSTFQTKQKALTKAIYSNYHFRNLIKNREDLIPLLCQNFVLRQFKKKDVLYSYNQNVKEVHWILSGQISCWDRKTEQDINTEIKLIGVYQQFIQNNDLNFLNKEQTERLQNIKIRLNYLRDSELDQIIKDIDKNNIYFQLDNICKLKRVRFLEPSEIAGENCAISGQKYDGLCVVSSDTCWVLTLPTEKYNQIFNMNKENFYFIKETLQSVFGFANQKLITRLAYQFEALNYQYNQVIYNEGDSADCVYIIKSGEIELVKSFNMNQMNSLSQNPNGIQSGNFNIYNLESSEAPLPNEESLHNEESSGQSQICQFSKYKRKIKPKITETQIALKNCGILGLEDYEVGVSQQKKEGEQIGESKNKSKSGDKGGCENSKKQKLRNVKAVSKSNDTVLLKIRDKYIDALFREQGISRTKLSHNMKIQKQQYYSERLKKVHEYVKCPTHVSHANLALNSNNSDLSTLNTLNHNNNTTNNLNNNNPLTSNTINQAFNFNHNQDFDDLSKIHKLSIKKHESNMTSLPSLVMKSQVHFGILTDNSVSHEDQAIQCRTQCSNNQDQINSNNIYEYSNTPQIKPTVQRSAMKHLSSINIKSIDKTHFQQDDIHTEPIQGSLKMRSIAKRFTDISSASTAPSSLKSIQKLSPTFSIPINSYQKNQINSSCNNSTLNSPLPQLTDQHSFKNERPQPSKTLTDISYQSTEYTPSKKTLAPIQLIDGGSERECKERQQQGVKYDSLKEYNLFDSNNPPQNIRNSGLQNSQHVSKHANSNSTILFGSPQKVQLDLLFLLPEKTKMLNQKFLMRQQSMIQQKNGNLQQGEKIKPKSNVEISHNQVDKIGCSNRQRNDIVSLAEVDLLQLQQNANSQQPNQENKNDKQQETTTTSQDDKKVFMNRLKSIHPTIKKCKTIQFQDQEINLQQNNVNSSNTIKESPILIQQNESIKDQPVSKQPNSSSQIQTNNNNFNIKSQLIKQNDNGISKMNDNYYQLISEKQLNQQQQQKQQTQQHNEIQNKTLEIKSIKSNKKQDSQKNESMTDDEINQAPLSIMSYSKSVNEIKPQQNCIFKDKSIYLQPRNKNIVELLRRNNYRAKKHYLQNINQNEKLYQSSAQNKNIDLNQYKNSNLQKKHLAQYELFYQ